MGQDDNVVGFAQAPEPRGSDAEVRWSRGAQNARPVQRGVAGPIRFERGHWRQDIKVNSGDGFWVDSVVD